MNAFPRPLIFALNRVFKHNDVLSLLHNENIVVVVDVVVPQFALHDRSSEHLANRLKKRPNNVLFSRTVYGAVNCAINHLYLLARTVHFDNPLP